MTLIPGVRPLFSDGYYIRETPSGGVGNDLVGSGTMRGASQVVSHNGAGPVHPASAMPIGARPAHFDFMAKYRKKPVVIEAIQWTGDNMVEVQEFCGEAVYFKLFSPPIPTFKTLEGELSASIGDWIIKGVKGEFYPCRDDIFQATYEKVEDAS